MTSTWIVLCAGLMAVFAWPGPPGGVLRTRWGHSGLRRWASALSVEHLLVLTGLVGAIGWLIAGLLGAVVGGVSGLALSRALSQRRARPTLIRGQLLQAQLAETLELLAAALEAGVSLRRAVEQVAVVAPSPTKQVLACVLRHLDIGCPPRQAWLAVDDQPGWGPVARDIATVAESGAGLTTTLVEHAREAAATFDAVIASRARTVSVRSVLPLMCCYLPSFLLVGVVPIIAGVLSKGLFG